MTRLLSDMLHERAASAPGPQVDLDAIIGDGDRRVRSSRLTTGLAAAAVAAVVAGSSFVLPGLVAGGPEAPVAGAASPFAERRAGYALDGVIHWGNDSFPVGMPVASYVQTDDGFVLTTRKGDVFLFDGTDSRRIGSTSNQGLRADDTGSLVAWVDDAEDGHPQYVVFDTRTMTEVARVDDDVAGPAAPGAEHEGGATVYALDDGSAYWRVGDEIVRYDIAGGESEVVTRWTGGGSGSEPGPAVDLVDVAAGKLAYRTEGRRGSTMSVGERVGDLAVAMPSGWNGALSPDGRYLGVEEADEMAIYETSTGAVVTPAGLGRYPFSVVTGWVDDDTATVFAIKDLAAQPYAFDLLTCDVPTGACDVVTQGDVATDPESFVVPVGDPMT